MQTPVVALPLKTYFMHGHRNDGKVIVVFSKGKFCIKRYRVGRLTTECELRQFSRPKILGKAMRNCLDQRTPTETSSEALYSANDFIVHGSSRYRLTTWLTLSNYHPIPTPSTILTEPRLKWSPIDWKPRPVTSNHHLTPCGMLRSLRH